MSTKTAHVTRFLAFFTAVVALFTVFFTGCSTSEDWVRGNIQRYYYRFDGDYSSVAHMDGLSIDEMMSRLDKYCKYYTAEEYRTVLNENAGHKTGIGVSQSLNPGGGILIKSVTGGSPAEAAGLKAGDIVLAISSGGETVQLSTTDSFANFIRAVDEGQNITLSLSDGRDVTVLKSKYTASYASMYTAECRYSFVYDGDVRRLVGEDGGGITELPEHTAYIRLSQFFGMAADELRSLVKIFNEKNCSSLVLDLRGNGGGYVNVLADIGGVFTSAEYPSAVALRAVYKNGSGDTVYCTRHLDGILPGGTKIYLMANEDSASASEALMGILVSYGLLDYGDIFLSDYGTRAPKTYGKGIMQSVFENKREAVKLTVAGLFWENGRTIHNVGLTLADGCVAAPAGDETVDVGFDDELLPVIDKIIADSAQDK